MGKPKPKLPVGPHNATNQSVAAIDLPLNSSRPATRLHWFVLRLDVNMKIDRVTITGADDGTDIQWMLAMQERFPFVEWGILVSHSQMGGFRFPSVDWLAKLIPHQDKLQTSMHVCGRWVRRICDGDWSDMLIAVGVVAERAKRVQLNFHAHSHKLNDRFFKAAQRASQNSDWQLIFQIDGVNDGLLEQARLDRLDAVPLYDLSGGAGVLPSQWPKQSEGVYTGYAGGLGPRNVIGQVERIKSVAGGRIWIDMETRVRTADDSKLDETLVESVLDQCSKMDCLQLAVNS